eukprot:162277-Rhodomonas_salina.1
MPVSAPSIACRTLAYLPAFSADVDPVKTLTRMKRRSRRTVMIPSSIESFTAPILGSSRTYMLASPSCPAFLEMKHPFAKKFPRGYLPMASLLEVYRLHYPSGVPNLLHSRIR